MKTYELKLFHCENHGIQKGRYIKKTEDVFYYCCEKCVEEMGENAEIEEIEKHLKDAIR